MPDPSQVLLAISGQRQREREAGTASFTRLLEMGRRSVEAYAGRELARQEGKLQRKHQEAQLKRQVAARREVERAKAGEAYRITGTDLESIRMFARQAVKPPGALEPRKPEDMDRLPEPEKKAWLTYFEDTRELEGEMLRQLRVGGWNTLNAWLDEQHFGAASTGLSMADFYRQQMIGLSPEEINRRLSKEFATADLGALFELEEAGEVSAQATAEEWGRPTDRRLNMDIHQMQLNASVAGKVRIIRDQLQVASDKEISDQDAVVHWILNNRDANDAKPRELQLMRSAGFDIARGGVGQWLRKVGEGPSVTWDNFEPDNPVASRVVAAGGGAKALVGAAGEAVTVRKLQSVPRRLRPLFITNPNLTIEEAKLIGRKERGPFIMEESIVREMLDQRRLPESYRALFDDDPSLPTREELGAVVLPENVAGQLRDFTVQ